MSRRTFGEELNDVLGVAKSSVDTETNLGGVHREFKSVFPHEISPGTYQPRKNFDQTSLQELSDSIKEKGILQPLIVRSAGEGYELVAGERRWRAAQMAGLKQVPVVVCEIDNNAALAFSLIENIQRQDLNPIEEAIATKRLLEEFSMTHKEVAKSIGKSRTMVTNMLRLLKLAEPVKKMLVQRELEMGHARALVSLSEEQQVATAEIIASKQMTAREVEAYVSLLQTEPQKTTSLNSKSKQNSKLLLWEKELMDLLGVMVKIKINSKGRGRVVCNFSTLHDIEALINKLRKTKKTSDCIK